MQCSGFRCLLVLSMVLSAWSILVGRLRRKEEPASNVVPSSAFLFPSSEDDAPRCKTDDGYPGLCIDIRRCYAARRAVSSRNHPIRCGWINNYVPRVCCHPDQVQRPKMVFETYRDRRRNRGSRMV